MKKTTGEVRRMVCIFDPEAAEKATFRFNPRDRGLLPVWDTEKGAPRLINLEGVRKVVVGGRTVYEPAAEPTQGVRLPTRTSHLYARRDRLEADLEACAPEEEAAIRAEMKAVQEEIMRRRLRHTIATHQLMDPSASN